MNAIEGNERFAKVDSLIIKAKEQVANIIKDHPPAKDKLQPDIDELEGLIINLKEQSGTDKFNNTLEFIISKSKAFSAKLIMVQINKSFNY